MTERRKAVPAVGTVCAGNFGAFARVLIDSFRAWHPDVPFHLVFTDESPAGVHWTASGCTVVPLSALGIPNQVGLCFGATRRQLAIAAKPYLLRYLLDLGYDAAVFLDADVLVTGPLDPLFALATAHTLTLTPHLLEPPSGAAGVNRELTILRSGIYNGGCVAVDRSGASRTFLEWWGDRVAVAGGHDPGRGMHYDQRWLDFAPSFVDDLAIAREPGLNVAYWNQQERQLYHDGNAWRVKGDVCRFFHFSGFDPLAPSRVTLYWPEMTTAEMGGAAPLFEYYAGAMLAAGHETLVGSPYAFERFDNGVRIPDIARVLYRRADPGAERFGDPFATAGSSYYRWLTTADAEGGVPRIWQAVYDARPDLQTAFPDPAAADRAAFAAWTQTFAVEAHQIDPALSWRPLSL